MTRLSRFVAVAVLLGGSTVFLSACSDSSEPVASVTASPPVVSETPSVSPTPTALTDDELLALIPESARAENFGSAVNFATFFVGLYPEMMRAKDSRLFTLLSDDTCVFCENSLESYGELIAANGSVTGGDMTFDLSTASGGLQSNGTWNASFDVVTSEAIYLDANGNVSSTDPERSGRLGVSLRYDREHWTVLGVGSGAA